MPWPLLIATAAPEARDPRFATSAIDDDKFAADTTSVLLAAQSGTAVRQAVDVGSLGQKPLPQRGERRDCVLTVLGRVVAAAEFVEQVGTVGCHQ
jgi:hypothetical protein